MPEPKLNAREKAQVAGYVARMCKRGLAGEHVYTEDLKRKVDRVIERAAKRQQQGK
ncbi:MULTISPECIES: DUF6257 family protein [unclassified Streptomyces]|uniref:DUF6257 family protein n=1 Tax=unclassified Streptomyces TaxID=2593676 RepID=UPI0032492357|nr:DUF6257 family protein [Streptomyces sp. NBC_01180]